MVHRPSCSSTFSQRIASVSPLRCAVSRREADQRLGLSVLILDRLPQRLKLDVLQDALSRAFGWRTPDPRRLVRFDHLALEPQPEHLAYARQGAVCGDPGAATLDPVEHEKYVASP